MKIKLTLLAAAVALAPMSAMAGGSLDVFYIYNEQDVAGGQDPDGHGVGVRGEADLGNNISFTGMYQSSDLDDAGLRETRIGLKYSHALNKILLTGDAEHVNITSRPGPDGDDGYAVKVGGKVNITERVTAFAKVGYLNLHNTGDGAEYEVGGAIKVTDQISGFLEYRYIDIKEDANNDLELSTIRAGARYTF